MAHHEDETDDAPLNFFSKDNPVAITLYFDQVKEVFVAVAKLANTDELICEETDDEEPGEALDAVAGTLLLLTQKPGMFNEHLRKIGENANKKLSAKDKAARKVVQLR